MDRTDEVESQVLALSSDVNVKPTNATKTTKHRQLRAELNCLKRADGSCCLEQGATVLWATVNGPGDVASSKRLCETLYVEVVYRHQQSNQSSLKITRLLSCIIKQTVDCIRYPHQMLAVTLQEMQCDGSEMAAAATSTCLALLDSGIAMNSIFCGVCIACKDNTFILDPSKKQVLNADSLFTFIFKSFATVEKEERKIILIGCCTDGVYEYSVFETAMIMARKASEDLFVFLRETMQRKLSVDDWMVDDSR